MQISRAEFEQCVAQFEAAYIDCIKVALQDAGMDRDDISEVVMVGGTTKTPIVKQKISEFFGGDVNINDSVNPDTVVAYGATVYAGKLSGQAAADEGVEEITLNDVTPLPVGLLQSTEIEQGFLASIFSKTKFEETMDTYIHKNSTIPFEKTKTITITSNDKALIVLEGDKPMAADNVVLGEIPIAGMRAGDRVDVKFNIDTNNILTVSATNSRRGNTA